MVSHSLVSNIPTVFIDGQQNVHFAFDMLFCRRKAGHIPDHGRIHRTGG